MRRTLVIFLCITAASLLTLALMSDKSNYVKRDVSPWNELEFNTPSGKNIRVSDYDGKVLLIVNTASRCGFTPHLNGLQELQDKFGKDGLVVLGFPCDQFGSQEPESNSTVEKCYNDNNGVSFQLSEKIDVNGDNAHPLFVSLNNHFEESIDWNFEKFLIEKAYATFIYYTYTQVMYNIT